MAANMFDLRRPKRTRTESAAQPTAEPMATISANREVKAGLSRKLQINELRGDLQLLNFEGDCLALMHGAVLRSRIENPIEEA
jgi:hypothetical protein